MVSNAKQRRHRRRAMAAGAHAALSVANRTWWVCARTRFGGNGHGDARNGNGMSQNGRGRSETRHGLRRCECGCGETGAGVLGSASERCEMRAAAQFWAISMAKGRRAAGAPARANWDQAWCARKTMAEGGLAVQVDRCEANRLRTSMVLGRRVRGLPGKRRGLRGGRCGGEWRRQWTVYVNDCSRKRTAARRASRSTQALLHRGKHVGDLRERHVPDPQPANAIPARSSQRECACWTAPPTRS